MVAKQTTGEDSHGDQTEPSHQKGQEKRRHWPRTPLSLSPVSLSFLRSAQVGKIVQGHIQQNCHEGAVAGPLLREMQGMEEDMTSFHPLESVKSPLSFPLTQSPELPTIIAYDEAPLQRQQEAQQKQHETLQMSFCTGCDEIRGIVEHPVESCHDVDVFARRLSSTLPRPQSEEKQVVQEAQEDMGFAESCESPASLFEWGFPPIESYREGKQRQGDPADVMALERADSLISTLPVNSATCYRPFSLAPVCSCEMTCEEERVVLEQAQRTEQQQQQPQQQQQQQQQEELRGSFSGLIPNDAQEVITLRPRVSRFILERSPTPCPSISPFASTTGTASFVPLGAPVMHIDSVPSIFISPLSRPLSAWMDTPHSIYPPRRETLAPMGVSTPSQLAVQQLTTEASPHGSSLQAIPSSPFSRGAGEGASAGYAWSLSGIFDMSFNRTPKNSLSSSPLQRAQGCLPTRNGSSNSDGVLAYSWSTDSVKQSEQERCEGGRLPPSRSGANAGTPTKPAAAAAPSTKATSGAASQDLPPTALRVPPVQTMRRPPTVPQRTFPQEFPMHEGESNFCDEEQDQTLLSDEDFSNTNGEESDNDDEGGFTRTMQHPFRQRLFEPSPSRWRSSRRHILHGASKRQKRGDDGMWDLSARLRELERIRVSNHEAMEEREMQSIMSTEMDLNPVETSCVETEAGGINSIVCGQRRRRGRVCEELRETRKDVSSAALDNNDASCQDSTSHGHTRSDGGRETKESSGQEPLALEEASHVIEKGRNLKGGERKDRDNSQSSSSSSSSSIIMRNNGCGRDDSSGMPISSSTSSGSPAKRRKRRNGGPFIHAMNPFSDVCSDDAGKVVEETFSHEKRGADGETLCPEPEAREEGNAMVASLPGVTSAEEYEAVGKKDEKKGHEDDNMDTTRTVTGKTTLESGLSSLCIDRHLRLHRKTPVSTPRVLLKRTPRFTALPRRGNNLAAWVRNISFQRREEGMMQFIGGSKAFKKKGSRGFPLPMDEKNEGKDDNNFSHRRRKLAVRSSGKNDESSIQRGCNENNNNANTNNINNSGCVGVMGSAGVSYTTTTTANTTANKMANVTKATAWLTSLPVRASNTSFERKACGGETTSHVYPPAQHVKINRTAITAAGVSASSLMSPLLAANTLVRTPPIAAVLAAMHWEKPSHSACSVPIGGRMEKHGMEFPIQTRASKPHLYTAAEAVTVTTSGTSPTKSVSRPTKNGNGHTGMNNGGFSKSRPISQFPNVNQGTISRNPSNLTSVTVSLEKRRVREGLRGVSGSPDIAEDQGDAPCPSHGLSKPITQVMSCDSSMSTNELNTPTSRGRPPHGGTSAVADISHTVPTSRPKSLHVKSNCKLSSKSSTRLLNHSNYCFHGTGTYDVPHSVDVCTTSGWMGGGLRWTQPFERVSPSRAPAVASQKQTRHNTTTTTVTTTTRKGELMKFSRSKTLQTCSAVVAAPMMTGSLPASKSTKGGANAGNQNRPHPTSVTPNKTRMTSRYPHGGGGGKSNPITMTTELRSRPGFFSRIDTDHRPSPSRFLRLTTAPS
ncbi:hypothetical protein MOQ_010038 [Trypanosoma cruzi marinkellei]|uniref:Uncharacterized protein n=1 Tax=Trypanosoma cruzi marinkellei TaxID=85056 RepID=K2MKM9_TRYCR|nr:hypothetical protein MOQ_010038 [Trypanosoma cruzi marinkellei]